MPTKKQLESMIRELTLQQKQDERNLDLRQDEIDALTDSGSGAARCIERLEQRGALQTAHIKELRQGALGAIQSRNAYVRLITALQLYIVKNGLMTPEDFGRDDFPEMEPPF